MIRLGIICPSEIAFRRFLPALEQLDAIAFVGVAYAAMDEWAGATAAIIQQEKEKAQAMVDAYGGQVFESYQAMIESDAIDAVYLPLPPALHYQWATKALQANKHVLIEKPSTTSLQDSADLVSLAKAKGLALYENYMFTYHAQMAALDEAIASGVIGEVRLIDIAFGFPMRPQGDFRYNKALGGGALLDCGGYTLKYATYLLGDRVTITSAHLGYVEGYEVDMYGAATLTNEKGQLVRVAFGMDNAYKCDLEVWGSKGTLTSGRVLTAPVGFAPSYTIKVQGEESVHTMPEDDTFKQSIVQFVACMESEHERLVQYDTLLGQAQLVDDFIKLSK